MPTRVHTITWLLFNKLMMPGIKKARTITQGPHPIIPTRIYTPLHTTVTTDLRHPTGLRHTDLRRITDLRRLTDLRHPTGLLKDTPLELMEIEIEIEITGGEGMEKDVEDSIIRIDTCSS